MIRVASRVLFKKSVAPVAALNHQLFSSKSPFENTTTNASSWSENKSPE